MRLSLCISSIPCSDSASESPLMRLPFGHSTIKAATHRGAYQMENIEKIARAWISGEHRLSPDDLEIYPVDQRHWLMHFTSRGSAMHAEATREGDGIRFHQIVLTDKQSCDRCSEK